MWLPFRHQLMRAAVLLLIGHVYSSPSRAQDFTRGPFVQNATSNGIQIIWETAAPSRSRIEYGLTANLDTKITANRWDTNHVAALDRLLPNTRYFYRISSLSGRGLAVSSLESFSTLKTQGSIPFAVISDTAQNAPCDFVLPQTLLANVLAELRPELVLHLGDIVGRDFDHDTVQTQFFNIFQPVIKTTPFYLAVGNHDLFPPTGAPADINATAFQKAFNLPTNSMDGTPRYYSFDQGDAHFICPFKAKQVGWPEKKDSECVLADDRFLVKADSA